MTIRSSVAPRRPDVEDVEKDEYGEDRYCYIDGERYSIGRVVTLHPHEGDTNGDFEARVHRTVQCLYVLKRVTSVTIHFRKQKGSFTECLFQMVYPPRPAPLEYDERLAGGRFNEQRGRRGGGAGRRDDRLN